MIWYFTPYSLTKNIGAEYNRYMSIIGNNDTGVIMDGDTCYLTPDYGTIISEYVSLYPNAVLTCKTNRIHPLSKQLDNYIDEKCDMRQLICKAEDRKHLRTVTEIYHGEGMSALLMVIPKKIWEEVPFVEKGMLGVDSQFRIDLHKAGKKILIMDGLFIYHTYRLLTGINDKRHLYDTV